MHLKTDLHRYLRDARSALLWKLDGLPEYDVRRPLTRTGTNLLGLVKHLTGVELLYFGMVFGRPFEDAPEWLRQDAEPNTDFWAAADESRESVIGLYERVCAHSDATIGSLDLDAVGYVPWWSAEAPLGVVLIHVVAECHRHAGHADVVRELIDGAAGLQKGNDFMPPADDAWWATYRNTVEGAARAAAGRRSAIDRH